VRIDALYQHLGRRTRVLLDLLALIVLGIFVAALLERAWDVASTSAVEQIRSNTPLRIPLAWAQVPWFGGIALFALVLVLAVLRTLLALARGDYATAAATSSAVTQHEEVETELEGLGIDAARTENAT
jgi:TRAP-type C4-dicarboxylate transport system permease small subunit